MKEIGGDRKILVECLGMDVIASSPSQSSGIRF